jgi:CHAD domain-containing protein
MDYGFRRDESTSDGIRRIAGEQLERAVAELSGTPTDGAVHDVRKRMKKLRGLLRLADDALGDEHFALENACYRDAARRLASARRAAVTIDTFDQLIQRNPGALPEAASKALRAELVGARNRALGALHEESHAAGVTAVLEDALGRVLTWPLEHEHWKAFGAGYRDVYRRARRAYEMAHRVPNTEHLHLWRRWAKYHFYHVRLLRRIWPALEHPLVEALEELTELLGVEHDLDDLRATLIEKAAPPELSDATHVLLDLLAVRREELRAAAFSLGARLFAERPGAAERRMRAYYRAWHGEAPLPPHHSDVEDD